VFGLLEGSLQAKRNFKYRDQLQESAAGVSKQIAEGYQRCSPLDFARFLDYALGSLAEAEERLRDGIQLRYFEQAACEKALRYAVRASKAILGLKQSQIRYAARQRHKLREERGKKLTRPAKGSEPATKDDNPRPGDQGERPG
jgi:four helix bundle protein